MRIERPGLLTTVQDLGRRGYQALGVPPCGAMDSWSARLANRLAGNPDRFAVLEITIVGPRLTIDREAWIAVVGAEMIAASSWTDDTFSPRRRSASFFRSTKTK